MSQSTWEIIWATVQGASHFRKDMPNQDSIAGSRAPGHPLTTLVVSDGHGSDRYFRSDVGAEKAIQAAQEACNFLLRDIGAEKIGLDVISKLVRNTLPRNIHSMWLERVKDHYDKVQFTAQEREHFYQRAKKDPYSREKKERMTDSPVRAYGATLLLVAIGETMDGTAFLFCLQLGDGNILIVDTEGKIFAPFGDEDMLGDEVDSLCSTDAAHRFKHYFTPLEDPLPVLIMVSTDGYANSYPDDEAFFEVAAEIVDLAHEKGWRYIDDNLKEWLQYVTEHGSGDDISAGFLYRPAAFTAPPKTISPAPAKSEQPASQQAAEVMQKWPKPGVKPYTHSEHEAGQAEPHTLEELEPPADLPEFPQEAELETSGATHMTADESALGGTGDNSGDDSPFHRVANKTETGQAEEPVLPPSEETSTDDIQ